MSITELEMFYETALRPVFGSLLHIVHERDDFAHVILDGEREEFFFTLYGTSHARLYWCNECFIFDSQRDSLVSSDTFGEIVYEGRVNAEELPQIIVNLVCQLNGGSFLAKEERAIGKVPSGYDDRKEYTIWAKKEGSQMQAYRLENIRIEFSS